MVRLQAILGAGGTGKSFRINQEIKKDPKYALRTATTGIAAVNMGSIPGAEDPTTINSALQYFNSENLLRKFHQGKTLFPLKIIGKKFRNLVIDEVSMMDAGTLDLIVMAVEQHNNRYKSDLGIIVSGDPGQLPPVQGKPFFAAKAWSKFQVTFLTEVKRQEDEEFIEALNLIRRGKAEEAAEWFSEHVQFTEKVNDRFRGTTFFSTNNEVDIFNKRCLSRLIGDSKSYYAKLDGTPDPSWKNIPQRLELKPGCIIQLLYNNLEHGFANGDSAIVNELWKNSIYISLLRKNKELFLRPRKLEYFGVTNKGYKESKPKGTLQVMHARLAYALTVHKSQGLTLDAVQLDLKSTGSQFLSKQSGMLYTALSRVRSPEGLTIVGTPRDLVRCCYVNPGYLEWIQ